MPSSRGSSQPRDRIHISRIAGGFFTVWATREALDKYAIYLVSIPLPRRAVHITGTHSSLWQEGKKKEGKETGIEEASAIEEMSSEGARENRKRIH